MKFPELHRANCFDGSLGFCGFGAADLLDPVGHDAGAFSEIDVVGGFFFLLFFGSRFSRFDFCNGNLYCIFNYLKGWFE